MTPEEAASLKEELQTLQQQLTTQQAEHTEQQRVHDAAVRSWQEERKQLQQQVQDAQLAAQQAQQDAAHQTQQLQADADSHAGLMRHLSWQLEAAQQALAQQHQQQGREHGLGHGQTPAQGELGSEEGDSSLSALAAQHAELSAAQERASRAECQCAQVLQFLADEAAALTPQGLVTHCMSDQLLEGVSGTIATLVSLYTEPFTGSPAHYVHTFQYCLVVCMPKLGVGSILKPTCLA
jgi:DNA repair exonuclease SbcCD ATPase subunit